MGFLLGGLYLLIKLYGFGLLDSYWNTNYVGFFVCSQSKSENIRGCPLGKIETCENAYRK